MKRVKSACLQQIVRFELNDKLEHTEAAAAALREAAAIQERVGA